MTDDGSGEEEGTEVDDSSVLLQITAALLVMLGDFDASDIDGSSIDIGGSVVAAPAIFYLK